MPTYLSPGVYVEEVSSGSKPIEGVGTAIAAFVGMAPKGPANQPTLVTNWRQYAEKFGDITAGAYLGHAVYGYFLNGGGTCYVVRVGSGQRRRRQRRPCRPARARIGDLEVRALEAGPDGQRHDDRGLRPAGGLAGGDRPHRRHARRRARGARGPAARRARQRRQHAQPVAARPRRARAGDRPARGPAPRAHQPGRRRARPGRRHRRPGSAPTTTSATRADRTGFAGLETIPEVTMVAVPDAMAAYQQGVIDLEGLKAIQLGMIAHCELMGNRVAILDAPPSMNAQQVRDWRMDQAGYDSKFAALYWPWIKVFDPATRREHARPAERPRRRHLRPQRRHPWRAQGAGQRGHPRRHRPRGQHHQGRARHAQPGRRQLHPVVPRPGHPGLGRPHAVERSRSGATSTCAGCSTTSRTRSSTARSGRCSSPTTTRCGPSCAAASPPSSSTEWRKGALFGLTPAEAFFVKCDAETNPAEAIDVGQVTCEIGVAPVKPAEFVIFRLSQFSGGTSLVAE